MFEIHAMTPEHPLWNETATFAETCSWSAGGLLAQLMREKRFLEWERVYAACEDGRVIGYCTFSAKDEMPEKYDFSPFIGFVFVEESCRGQRISGRMIERVIEYARTLGYEKIYIMSGEQGLYEKYGFTAIGEYETIYDWTDRLFVREI